VSRVPVLSLVHLALQVSERETGLHARIGRSGSSKGRRGWVAPRWPRVQPMSVGAVHLLEGDTAQLRQCGEAHDDHEGGAKAHVHGRAELRACLDNRVCGGTNDRDGRAARVLGRDGLEHPESSEPNDDRPFESVENRMHHRFPHASEHENGAELVADKCEGRNEEPERMRVGVVRVATRHGRCAREEHDRFDNRLK
jgi:hypothetical protein